MSKYIKIEEQESEAGNPHYKEKEEQQQTFQGLISIDEDEPEAGRPYIVPPKKEEQQLTTDDDLNKAFNAKEAYDKLMESIRTPRSHQTNVEQASKDKKFRESISALSLLLNTAKGAFGGNIRKEDYSGITAAANEAKGYQAMEDKDADRYDDAKSKLWMDLYNLQLKDKSAQRSYLQKIEQLFAKEGADARNIARRDKATKEQIVLRGDVDLDKEDFRQKGKLGFEDKLHGNRMAIETFKQKGRERLAALRVELKKSGDIDKTFIDVKSPYSKDSIGLTKGEALEFFNWLLDNGDVTQADYTLMFESLTGTAANNMVQSKVVDYVKKYPQPMKQILSNRGKGIEKSFSANTGTSKGNPLQFRSTIADTGKGDPLQPRK